MAGKYKDKIFSTGSNKFIIYLYMYNGMTVNKIEKCKTFKLFTGQQ